MEPTPGSSKDPDPSPPHLLRDGKKFMRNAVPEKATVKKPLDFSTPLHDPKQPDIKTVFARTTDWESSYEYLKQVKILAFTEASPR